MHFLGKIRGSQTACLMAYGLHSQLTKGSSGSIMGTRMIHKRDKKHAAHVSKIALRMMAVLVMSGDYIPACLIGMIHRAEHRRSLQREMHWRKTYASHGFNWDSEAWNDGQCQDLLHWPRGGAEKLGRLFFLPAMQSAPGTNGVKLLQQDSDGQRCGWLAGCCLRRLRICARPAHHARTQTEHAPHRSYARAAGRVEWPAPSSLVDPVDLRDEVVHFLCDSNVFAGGGRAAVISRTRGLLSFLRDSVFRDPIADPALHRLQRARYQCGGRDVDGGGGPAHVF